MPKQYFLIKSEPSKYAFADLIRDGKTVWDGVRNYEARNNLRAMKKGDALLYYHSNEGKAVVGVAAVSKSAYPDPTAPDEDWSVVEIKPLAPLAQPVTLDAIRKEPKLQEIQLVRKGRISVVPVTAQEFTHILKMGRTKLPERAKSPPRRGGV
jgi:predicted RNA-binding protein with PUA-like domain